MRNERLDIPLIIGGEEIRTGNVKQAVMPHDKDHVLADVHQGGPKEVEAAVKASAAAWEDWHRVPWEERAAVFLRAAELLAGPWRDTLNAATMLGQSKTAHQAEIDAACELIDFWRFNPAFMIRMYEEQPVSSPGVWNRLEYRPLEGFVFAVSPFNFTAIGGNLTGAPALMGNTVLWKPASTAMLSAYYTMRIFQEAGLPDGVINLVYGSGKDIGDPALASPDLAGVHFTGSTAVFQGMWKTIGQNIASYRSYPRIVGETGGKDFIVAHPTADAEAVATAILRGSFEYQGQKCSAASRVYAPESMWPAIREQLVAQVGELQLRRRLRLLELHGRRHRRKLLRHAEGGDRGGQGEREERDRRGRRVRRQRGLLRAADGDPHRGPRLPPSPRRALRAGRDDLRLPGRKLGGDARADRPHGPVRAHRRDLRGRPRGRRSRRPTCFATRRGTST